MAERSTTTAQMVGVAPRLLDVRCMPTNEKSEKHDDADEELQVEFEPEVDDDEDKEAKDDEDEDTDDEAEVVDIDLDDLSGMEGPDA